jgi:2-amino-4-hydroxy-6-hydroxymethyldihydropteridine diphosphokinase
MANKVVVSLGSNIDKETNLPRAVQIMGELCRVVAVSGCYETAPAGDPGQPIFFNAAVLVETELDARSFKKNILARIEEALHRERTADPNAPRTIDADLILFNNETLDLGEGRHIPDPDLLRYVHVAVPVAELLPGGHHPETGEPFSAIAARLLSQNGEAGQPAPRKRPDIRLVIGGP